MVVIQGCQHRCWGANECASLKASVDALSDSCAVPVDQDTADNDGADRSIAAGSTNGLLENHTADNLHATHNSDTKRRDDIQTNPVFDGKNREYDGAISKLGMAYMHLCEDMNDNENNLKSEMLEIKSEIRKVPLKIMDLIKKDIKGINNSVCDVVSAISEDDSYKTQIYQLTEQLQHQCKDIWKLQRSLAAAQRTAALLTTAFPSSHVTDTVTSLPAPSGSTGLSPSSAPSPTTEGSAMGGDRTASLAASNPHTADRDSNSVPPPVPSPPNPTWDTAPHDHAADTVAPTPLGSQAHASGPGVVPQINANSAQTEGNNAQETFTSPQRCRSQREHLLQQADVILITDSTGKYVDSSRFMGLQNYTFHERASTSDIVLQNLNRWPVNDDVKFVILHNGVNDVRDGKTVSEIEDNLKASLSSTKKRFPRAKSAFSEM